MIPWITIFSNITYYSSMACLLYKLIIFCLGSDIKEFEKSTRFRSFLQVPVLPQITFWQILRALVFDLLINSQWLTRY